LNNIEPVWSKLKDGLKKSYQSVEDLESDVKASWNNLDLEYRKTFLFLQFSIFANYKKFKSFFLDFTKKRCILQKIF